MVMSCSILVTMRNVSGSFVENIKKIFLCSKTFLQKIVSIIIWKDIVEPDGTQMKIWRMRITRSIPKTTNILSEYIILIAYPMHEWLRERASLLR